MLSFAAQIEKHVLFNQNFLWSEHYGFITRAKLVYFYTRVSSFGEALSPQRDRNTYTGWNPYLKGSAIRESLYLLRKPQGNR